MDKYLRQVIDRYNYIGKTGLYDTLMSTLLLGKDINIRKEVINENTIESGDYILDAGSGTGRNISLIGDIVGDEGKIDAYDVSSGMLEYGRARYENYRNCNVYNEDVMSIEETNKYDVVLASLIFSVYPYPEMLKRHFKKIIKPNGKIIVLEATVPSDASVIMKGLLSFEEWIAAANLQLDLDKIFSEFEVEKYRRRAIYIDCICMTT